MHLAHRLRSYLSQPYPFFFDRVSFLRFFILLSIIAFLFTWLFEPFVVNREEHRMPYVWICVLHALLPTLIVAIYYGILIWRDPIRDNWTIGKEVGHLLVVLLCIGVGNFLLRDVIYTNPNNWSWGYLGEEIRNTYLVGALLVGIFVPMHHERLARNNRVKARHFSPPVPVQSNEKTIPIKTAVQADDFELEVGKMLAARADGNYVELYVADTDGARRWIKRLPLKDLEAQLSGEMQVMRTHRAWLVNLQHVQSVSGNAQGYQLQVAGWEGGHIPVARSMREAFHARMEANSLNP
jgi:hypothetical protein